MIHEKILDHKVLILQKLNFQRRIDRICRHFIGEHFVIKAEFEVTLGIPLVTSHMQAGPGGLNSSKLEQLHNSSFFQFDCFFS